LGIEGQRILSSRLTWTTNQDTTSGGKKMHRKLIGEDESGRRDISLRPFYCSKQEMMVCG
jgi:hypothetical protein